MEPIRVVVQGASGKMGREVISAVCRDPETEIVGAVDLNPPADVLSLPDGGSVPFSADLERIIEICRPEVIIDFSAPRSSMKAARIALPKGVRLVVGTTGISPEEVDEIRGLCLKYKTGAVVAPNFALGAVLMMHLAGIASKYFDNAEIIELHHEKKADAPSGTALKTARMMAAAREKPFCLPPEKTPMESRGKKLDGIAIHSVRLPGLLAHQEVLFGGPGQTLSIRHDTISRECFMPGVMLATKEVVKRRELVYGLEPLLGL
jgi:4-hydroxy-tetrahydrodipicolinate reductase